MIVRSWVRAAVASLWLLGAAAGVVACSHSTTDDEGLGTVEGVATSKAGITAFVKDTDNYKDWCKEAEIHISTGPHPKRVRTYWNPVLFDSLTSGNAVHPKGSVAVKELYDDPEGKTLIGHAVAIKVADGEGEDTWVWFEGHGPDYGNPYYGKAQPTCRDCHTLAPRDNVWGYGQACY